MSRPAVSQCLHVLRASGLIRGSRQGKFIWYELEGDTLVEAELWLRGLVDVWASAPTLRANEFHPGPQIVLSICTLLTAGLGVAGTASALAARSIQHSSWVALATLTLGCAVVTAISAGATWRAGHRLASLDDVPVTATGREVLLDAFTTAERPLLAHPHGGAGFVRSTRKTTPGATTLVAPLAGSAVRGANLAVLILAGELDGPRLGQLATSTPALITIEGALVLTGYATLRRYLGLRPTRTATSRR